jgi:hypothetical protein
MADTPIQTIERDITWIRGHAIVALLTIALLAGSIIGGIYLFESLKERHDERVAAAQQQKENVDTATQARFMDLLQQEHSDNLKRDAAQTALIASLTSQMAQQRAATARQVTTDATLDAKAAAARLIAQTKASPSDVTTSNDTVMMTLPLTRTVVADLDLFAQSQSDVTNLQGQLGAQKILTSDSKVELDAANQVITADKVELIATIKADNDACNVRVDKQVIKDVKRGFWMSAASAVVGILLGRKI